MRTQMKQHRKERDMAYKKLKCPKCDRKFSMKAHLAHHLRWLDARKKEPLGCIAPTGLERIGSFVRRYDLIADRFILRAVMSRTKAS